MNKKLWNNPRFTLNFVSDCNFKLQLHGGHCPMVLALVPLQKFPTRLSYFALEDENGLALSKMEFQACNFTVEIYISLIDVPFTKGKTAWPLQ